MAKTPKNDDNIVKYKSNKNHLSIGFITVSVMFIYIAYHLFTYLSASNITIYEVTQGSISSNREYNALALREEQVFTCENSGSIVYLTSNNTRVGSKNAVYAIDTTGSVLNNININSLNNTSISEKDREKLYFSINNFSQNYNNSSYSSVYAFKSDLNSTIEQIYSLAAMEDMSGVIDNAMNSGTFHAYYSPTPGLVVYYKDGLENLTIEDVNNESFDSTNVNIINLKTNGNIQAGQDAYKLITSDKWKLVMQIDDELSNELSNDNYIKIEFLEDKVDTWCAMSIIDMEPNDYLVLDLDDSMDRYSSSRFVHIKLLDTSVSGLKIPNSAIVEKEFFKVPKSFFYAGNNSNDVCVMVQKDNNQNEMVTTTVYFEDDNSYYIDEDMLTAGDKLIRMDSTMTYTLGDDYGTLEGVYNVNKGYAVFKQIEVLYRNEEYSIVDTGTNYGISLYDHIVLQGDSVHENEIINKSTNQ